MRKKFIIVFILILIFIINFVVPLSFATDMSWSQYGYDNENTGYTPSQAPNTNTTFLNKQYDIGNVATCEGSPIVVNGKLYVGFSDETFYCINAYNGSIIWMKLASDLPGAISDTPAVENDQVYFGSGRYLMCLNASTGEFLWLLQTNDLIKGSPSVIDNKIYVGSYDKNLYCIFSNGTLSWTFQANEKIWTKPVVSENRVYFSASNPSPGAFGSTTYVYCLDATTGLQIWLHIPSLGPHATACTVADDNVYVGINSMLFCLDAVGKGDGTTSEIWTYHISPFSLLTSVAVAYNHVYFGSWFSQPNSIYCLDAQGSNEETTAIWTYSFEGSIIEPSCPPSIADEKIYCGITNKKLYCFNASGNGLGEGTILWDGSTSDYNVNGQPAIANGKVWVVTDRKIVIGFGENKEPQTPEQPSGPLQGETNHEYLFTTTTTDNDGDDLWYQWQIGSTTTSWYGPYSSGESVALSYTWASPGTYQIKVKARDKYDSATSWSLPAAITISTPQPQLRIICTQQSKSKQHCK